MNVILLEKLPNLGEIGTVVKVKSGYARNYLLPTNKAKIATPENIKEAQDKNEQLLKSAQQKLKQAKKLAKEIQNQVVSIASTSDDEGHLYGSVNIKEIVDFLQQQDISIEKKNIVLADGPFKQVGEHTAQVILHPEVSFDLVVNVVKEEKQ